MTHQIALPLDPQFFENAFELVARRIDGNIEIRRRLFQRQAGFEPGGKAFLRMGEAQRQTDIRPALRAAAFGRGERAEEPVALQRLAACTQHGRGNG